MKGLITGLMGSSNNNEPLVVHVLKREEGGEGIEGWIQPTCMCGWKGSKEYAHNDYQHTNVSEQETEHLKTMAPGKDVYRINVRMPTNMEWIMSQPPTMTLIHEVPKIDEKCRHDWPEAGGQTDLYGSCTKCGLSFQRYIHTEMP